MRIELERPEILSGIDDPRCAVTSAPKYRSTTGGQQYRTNASAGTVRHSDVTIMPHGQCTHEKEDSLFHHSAQESRHLYHTALKEKVRVDSVRSDTPTPV